MYFFFKYIVMHNFIYTCFDLYLISKLFRINLVKILKMKLHLCTVIKLYNQYQMLFTIIISTLIVSTCAQSLCTTSSDTPKCAIQFNGNYINCYCVVDPITNTVSRYTTVNNYQDDLNLCANSNQNTFCCPYNFLDRSNTFVYNGYVYDKMCNNIGIYTSSPPSPLPVLTTTNLEAYATIYVTPAPTPTPVLAPPQPTSTVTIVSVSTQIVPTTVVSVSTQIVPTVTTYTETIYPTPTPIQAAEIGPVPIPVPNPTPISTVTKTVVKTKTVVRTRIYRTTVCPQ